MVHTGWGRRPCQSDGDAEVTVMQLELVQVYKGSTSHPVYRGRPDQDAGEVVVCQFFNPILI
jgi:hypothetical protein